MGSAHPTALSSTVFLAFQRHWVMFMGFPVGFTRVPRTGSATATQTQGAPAGRLLGPSLRRALAVTHSLLSHIIARW